MFTTQSLKAAHGHTMLLPRSPRFNVLQRLPQHISSATTSSTCRPSSLAAASLSTASSAAPKTRKKQARLANLPIYWPIAGVSEPPQLRPHEVDIVNRLFKVESTLITSTSDPEDLPEWNVPEIAFAGRSNAGKSSLINALTGQKTLVRTSKMPGRTQQLHFLSVGGKKGSLPDLALVDMPGFGFASAPKKVVDEWHTLVGGYVDNRRGNNLKTTMLLVDARRGLGPADEDFMDFLHDLGALYQVVFTKVDACTRSELEKQIQKAQDIALSADRMVGGYLEDALEWLRADGCCLCWTEHEPDHPGVKCEGSLWNQGAAAPACQHDGVAGPFERD
jgi:GTP-binding protein